MEENEPRVLIVDDKEHNIRYLESLLSKQGYDIVVAHNGKEGLEQAAQAKPELIVLDVLMPDMDGFAVTRALRSRPETRAVPILMVTALNDVNAKLKGFEVGADDFLSRPFNGVELLARVKSLLRIERLNRELREKSALLEHVLARYVPEEVVREILNDPGGNH